MVEGHKYLCVYLDQQTGLEVDTDAVYKVRQCRLLESLYVLRKLRSISVCSEMLQILYGERNVVCIHLLGEQHLSQ